jgi:hypothetical protein
VAARLGWSAALAAVNGPAPDGAGACKRQVAVGRCG